MSKLREYYRSEANELFKPEQLNMREADFANDFNPCAWEEYLQEHCFKLMDEGNVTYKLENEDDWLEFVYRAQELLEIHENGYVYTWQNGTYTLEMREQ